MNATPKPPDYAVPAACSWPPATGTEGRLCQMIASRQRLGLKKYGVSIAENPLPLREWLMHALTEGLDQCAYLLRVIEKIDRDDPPCGVGPEQPPGFVPA